jgi:DNA-binding transcriptional ArsR family regulator
MTETRRPSSEPRPDGTRARLLALLREGAWTVDDLAERLSLTDNAVRFHMDALEKLGTVRKDGVRRMGVGQPASLYSLSSGGEEAFSRAYAPVLIACLEELRSILCSTGRGISQARGETSRRRFRAFGGPALFARGRCIGYAQHPRRNYIRREVGQNVSHCGARMSAIARSRGGSLRLRRRHFAGGGGGRRGGDGAVRSFGTSEVLL